MQLRDWRIEVKSEGYLLRAIGSDTYYEMLICLVASLRYHGDVRPISVFTDNPEHPILIKYRDLFDKLINIHPLVDNLSVKFQRDFSPGFEFGGLAPRLLCRESPYDKTISMDVDCMVVSSTEKLWEVFYQHSITFLGCPRMYPGWGNMTAEDITNAEIQIEDDLSTDGVPIEHCWLREAHGGIMWWDNSSLSGEVFDEIDKVVKSGRLYKYFPKTIELWWGKLSDEVVFDYVTSVLNISLIPYNSNLMGSNPDYFSVEKGEASMGHFMIEWGNRLAGHMKFKNSVPVFVHFFAKDKDPNYLSNKDFLFSWLEKHYHYGVIDVSVKG
jgi:hypothetical protein